MVEKREMLELFAVPDVYVSGLGSVETMGDGNVRFTLFTEQYVAGQPECVVALRFVISPTRIPAAMHMTAVETLACACRNVLLMTRN